MADRLTEIEAGQQAIALLRGIYVTLALGVDPFLAALAASPVERGEEPHDACGCPRCQERLLRGAAAGGAEGDTDG